MRKTNDTKNKKSVGAGPVSAQEGITLIALIITIIIMLILVAVTINMAVNGGLFEKAEQAVGETQNEVNKEQGLANGGITIDGKYYNSIDEYLNGGTTGSHNWTRTGDTFTCSHCNVTYEMGQVVNYTPAGKTSTTITAQMSGLDKYYTKNSSYPTEANVDENGVQTIEKQATNWVVLGIEDTDGNGVNETLLITTGRNVGVTLDKDLYLCGVAAYNNGPSEINRICEELYSNSEYGKARGMTIEDVNRTLNYTPLGGYYLDSEFKVHTTGNLTTKLKDTPTWNDIKEFVHNTKTPDGVNTEEALGNYELNGYYYYLNDEGIGLINDVNDETTTITEMERNVIFGEREDRKYWLPSRSIRVGWGSYTSVAFGLNIVENGGAGLEQGFFDSLGNERDYRFGFGLRPVVSLRFKLPEVLPTITFTINDTTYEASEGMTWRGWGNSSFCPYSNFSIPDYFENTDGDKVDVSPDDVIYPGGSYGNWPN